MHNHSAIYHCPDHSIPLGNYGIIPHEKIPTTPRLQLIREVERLTDELNLLLVSYEPILEGEGMRDHVEILQYWADCYRNGLAAADKISRNGSSWIADLCERTRLAAQELHRLEDDGGRIANNDQEAQINQALRATRQFSRIVPEIENLLIQQENSTALVDAE